MIYRCNIKKEKFRCVLKFNADCTGVMLPIILESIVLLSGRGPGIERGLDYHDLSRPSTLDQKH